MDTKTNYHIPRKLPKGERRVRFADSMGMELVSIFLIDLISNYYFASQKALQAPPGPTIINRYNKQQQQQQQQQHSQQQTSIQAKSSLSSIALPSSRTHITTNNNYHNTNTNTNHYHYNYHQQNHLHSQQQPPQHHHHHQQQQQNHHQKSLASNTNAAQITNQPSSKNFNYICDFTQPISLISFKERVRISKVHLETCQVNSTAGHVSVSCTIRVLNQSYDKSVIVRYTTDEWHTFTDSLASYRPGSCDGWSDKFTSTFSLTNQVKSFTTGQRIIFAIQYKYGGDNVVWDNNGGLNYSIKKI